MCAAYGREKRKKSASREKKGKEKEELPSVIGERFFLAVRHTHARED